MIRIESTEGVTYLSREDFQELIDMAEEGKAMVRQYDLSNALAPLPDPQADKAREALLAKCRSHLESDQ